MALQGLGVWMEGRACGRSGKPPIAIALILGASGVGLLLLPGASALATNGPFLFRASVLTNTINTNNPLLYGTPSEYIQGYSILDTLLTNNQDLKPANWLAYRYQNLGSQSSGGGDTYRFYLAPNTCFADPTATDQASFCASHHLTANDVVFTYNMLVYLHNHGVPAPALDGYVVSVQGAKWISSYVVDISFSRPSASWYATFSSIPILPEFQWGPVFNNGSYPSGAGPVNYEPEPLIGSGPFLEGVHNTQLLELKKNRYFWGPRVYGREVRPDVVQYIGYGGLGGVKLALLQGVVDVALELTPRDYLSLLQDPRVAVIGQPAVQTALVPDSTPSQVEVNFNLATSSASPRYGTANANPELRDEVLRQALAMSINRDEVLSKAFQGIGTRGETAIPASSPWHYDVPSGSSDISTPWVIPAQGEYPFDPTAARGLLNSNGWVYNGTYAKQNNGALKYDPNATPLAKDVNGDGKIDTGFYSGETLQFRFATINTADFWDIFYRLIQRWAALAGIHLMDGTGGECGNQQGCGFLSPFEMNAIWLSRDYDVLLWDIVLGGLSTDPGGILWFWTSFGYPYSRESGFAQAWYDAHFNTSMVVLDPVCRKRGVLGGPNCVGLTITLPNGATQPYYGTDGMQLYLYQFAADDFLVETVHPVAWILTGWRDFGDWRAHPGLDPTIGVTWLYFFISPQDPRAPILSPMIPWASVTGRATTLGALALDPGGRTLTFKWDLDASTDSDGDGIPFNDANVACPGDVACGPEGTITVSAPSVTADTAFPISVRISNGIWTVVGTTEFTVFAYLAPAARPVVFGVTEAPVDPTLGEPVTFLASAFSASGVPLSLVWAFGDGGTGSGMLAIHTYNRMAHYAATVLATDSYGNQAAGSSNFDVTTNVPPYIVPLPVVRAIRGTQMTFTGLLSDANPRDVLTCLWGFGDGTYGTGCAGANHTYANFGTYTYSLKVDDGRGHTAQSSATVYVVLLTGATTSLIWFSYSAATSTIYTLEPVTFKAQAAHPMGDPLMFIFSYPDGSRSVINTPATAPNSVVTVTDTFAFPTQGNQKVVLTVTDAEGRQVGTYISLNIRSNAAPTLAFPLVGQLSDVGSPVSYSFTPVDPDGDRIVWSFADQDAGQPVGGTVDSGTTVTVTRTYVFPGHKGVTLTLDDQHGHTVALTATTIIRGNLANFPFPFVRNGQLAGSFVLGNSQPKFYNGVQIAGAASTIDVVGGVPIAGAMGAVSTLGTINGLLDYEAVSADGTRVTAQGDFLTLGGPGNNLVSKVINPLLPVRFAGPGDGTGRGLYAGESRMNYRRCTNNTTPPCIGYTLDYGTAAISYDTLADRYYLMAAGLSGFSTRLMAQLIALNIGSRLPGGSVLTGTGVVVRFNDTNNDGTFDTYRVVDGTAGAAIMASEAAIPQPAAIAQRFAIGNSQVRVYNGVTIVGAASTIDVVGGVTLASRLGRDQRASGAIWASLDIELVTPDGVTVLDNVDNLMSFGGPGNNLVTRKYNSSLAVRFAGPPDGTGKGIFNSYTAINWRNRATALPYTSYALDSFLVDGGRTVEVVAGLSGFATRQASVALPQGVVSRGGHPGVVIELKDADGDGFFESVAQADLYP